MSVTVFTSPRFADHLTPPGHPERVERFEVMQAIASELYGVAALDPIVIVSVVGLLAIASLMACLGPARRAAKVNPVVALSQQ